MEFGDNDYKYGSNYKERQAALAQRVSDEYDAQQARWSWRLSNRSESLSREEDRWRLERLGYLKSKP